MAIDDFGNAINNKKIPSTIYKGFYKDSECIDDFGDLLYIHSYADYKLIDTFYVVDGNINQYNGVVVGPYIPQLNYRKLINKDKLQAHKKSMEEFHIFERNCNTCVKLVRVKHDKCSSGMLTGKCDGSKESEIKYTLFFKGDNFTFHPEDHMAMKCYISRFKHE